MLNKLLVRKNLNIIGLNSGTSADGLDLAAVSINLNSKKFRIKFMAGKTISYPEKLHTRIYSAINNRIGSIDDVIRLDRQLGTFYASRTAAFARHLKRNKIETHLIASHGQTVRHLPGKVMVDRSKQSGTLQLGHPESIAAMTGLITVADFRQADIARGGEGAPITSMAMYYLFSDSRENRMLINIGGISNYFLFPGGTSFDKMHAADCGPGNSLIDIIAGRLFGKKYDRNGGLAAKGKISRRLLTILMADNFLKGKFGPSTGRERFGEKFADKILKAASKLGLNKYDILATTTELTAAAIARAVRQKLLSYKIENIYLFGGGLKNRFLIKRLEANLEGIRFHSIRELGFNPDYLEAVCYAVMGAMTIRSIRTGIHRVTGATRDSVAGRIIQP
ncbi:MAG: anhydro-N-acetylmuramic acid kinase [Candidatus Zixiibacteriota bacterium]